jgi:hypothetical protein
MRGTLAAAASGFVYAAQPMASIGKRNLLSITRQTQSGAYLDGGPLGEILLPGKYVPRNARPG